jgi:hypothetical protein
MMAARKASALDASWPSVDSLAYMFFRPLAFDRCSLDLVRRICLTFGCIGLTKRADCLPSACFRIICIRDE